MKDMPMKCPKGLKIIAISQREDPRDAWLSHHPHPENSPYGSIVGTCSLRRQVLLEHYYPQLQCQNVRGNIQTRINKLGQPFDSLIMAVAGLNRLSLQQHIQYKFPLETFLPSPGQGFIALVAREDARIHVKEQDPESWNCACLERRIGQHIQLSCHAPAGIYVSKTAHYSCHWMIGDCLTKQLFYGQCDLDDPANDSRLLHEIDRWLVAHNIEQVMAHNTQYLNQL